ncbi:hypothetical protein TSMEX_003985 [Taenia solium]|eukprot:TsM_000259400 transcript=TsM_000259400 gene=TsM_000259400
MASMYKKEDNQIGLRQHAMPHRTTEDTQQTPQNSKGMTNKHVHWSQYADEISFFTIRDVVRLSDSIDDDYFSGEDVEGEEPLKGKRKHEKEIFIHPDFWQAVDNANLQSPPLLSPPLPQSPPPPPTDLNGKTRFVPAYETDSTLSDDSNFFDDPKYTEVKQSPLLRRSQSPVPKTLKYEKNQDPKAKKESKKKNKGDEEMKYSDKVTNSNGKASLKKAEKPPMAPKSPEGTVEHPNGAKKMHNSYWISPQIYLSKRDATSARGDYARGAKSSLESRKAAKQNGRSSSTERRRARSFSDYLYEPEARPVSETRRSNRHSLEERPYRSHPKCHYEYITENMKPNLPKVPPKRKRSTSKTKKCHGNTTTIIIITLSFIIPTTISVLITAVAATVINFIFAPIASHVTTNEVNLEITSSYATERVSFKKGTPNCIEIQIPFRVVLTRQMRPSPPEGLPTVTSHFALNLSKNLVVGFLFSCSAF